MGVGYYQNLTQWSKGEYSGANNAQDDFVVMGSYGLPFRTDDHGNTAGLASFIPAGASITATGIIEQRTDVDVFAFNTGAGTINLSVVPAPFGPNLDVYAELRNGSGALVASSNPLDFLSSSFNLSVPAGTYYLYVDGTGKGLVSGTGYSDYGSLGEYTINGTVIDPSGTVAPVAVATATPLSAPLSVQFNGTGSFDQDGSIVAWNWNFGDGAAGTGSIINYVYSSPGTYTATLTVTDNVGLTGTTSVTIQVLAPNVLPIAVATATPSSGLGPLSVTLSAAGSTDPDGTITSYQWAFGDGTPNGSGATITRTYANPGNYTATLTVTDNRGGTATATVAIAVTQNPALVIRLQSLDLVVQTSGGNKTGRATVKVTNLSGSPVSGVSVAGDWSGVVTGTASGNTDSNGNVVFTSKRFKGSGSITFQVNTLTKTGSTYLSANNLASTTKTVGFAPTP